MAAAVPIFLQSVEVCSTWGPSYYNQHLLYIGIDVYLIGILALKAMSDRSSFAPQHGKEAFKLQRSWISKLFKFMKVSSLKESQAETCVPPQTRSLRHR